MIGAVIVAVFRQVIGIEFLRRVSASIFYCTHLSNRGNYFVNMRLACIDILVKGQLAIPVQKVTKWTVLVQNGFRLVYKAKTKLILFLSLPLSKQRLHIKMKITTSLLVIRLCIQAVFDSERQRVRKDSLVNVFFSYLFILLKLNEFRQVPKEKKNCCHNFIVFNLKDR